MPAPAEPSDILRRRLSKPHPGSLRALAATARLANIPSVLSNVWLGIVLGLLSTGRAIDAGFGFAAAALCLAGICLYLAGNFINDWADRKWDAARRPERALPRGLFPPGLYLSLAAAFLLAGLGAAVAVCGAGFQIALTIAICILLYTWLHKRTACSVIPLALCRALLPLLGFVAITSPGEIRFSIAVGAAGLGLFCHIAGLSLSARREASEKVRHSGCHASAVLFVLAILASFSSAHFILRLPLLHCLTGLAPYILWITITLARFRQPVSAQVSRLLAGIPLVDWMLLLPLFLSHQTWPLPQSITISCLCLPPLAVLAGRALQRYASAT